MLKITGSDPFTLGKRISRPHFHIKRPENGIPEIDTQPEGSVRPARLPTYVCFFFSAFFHPLPPVFLFIPICLSGTAFPSCDFHTPD